MCNPVYSKEELVAECGAAFLCGHAGIEQKVLENSAAYVRGWLKALKNDKKMLVMAAAQAQKASDYILNIKGGEESEVTEDTAAKPTRHISPSLKPSRSNPSYQSTT
jgi:antirestriction protein ArdC